MGCPPNNNIREREIMNDPNSYAYGGFQEGDEVYMSPEEVAQFMAIGGQIEFL